jgi:hypothetical protein
MTFPLVLAALLLAAPPDPAVVEQVETLLGSIDTRIPTARWKGLGPAAVPVLAGIATAEGRMPSARSRAVVALGAVDAAEGERVARALVDAPDAPPTVRQAAVRTLGHLLAAARLRAALAPLLRSAPEPTLRAVAAETLARHAPDEGCAEVMDQVGLEAPGDRVRFERAATLCAGR